MRRSLLRALLILVPLHGAIADKNTDLSRVAGIEGDRNEGLTSHNSRRTRARWSPSTDPPSESGESETVIFERIRAIPILPSVNRWNNNNEAKAASSSSASDYELTSSVTGRGLVGVWFQVKKQGEDYVTYESYRTPGLAGRINYVVTLYNLEKGTYIWRVRAGFGYINTEYIYSDEQTLYVEVGASPIPEPTNRPTPPPAPTEAPRGGGGSEPLPDPTLAPTNSPTESPTDPPMASPTDIPAGSPVGGIKYGLQDDCNTVDTSKFNICLDLKSDSGKYEPWMDAFAIARDRWESIITDDGDPPVDPRGSFLADDVATELPRLVDDLYVSGLVVPLDGPGLILGMAGPTVLKKTADGKVRPIGGIMKFDSEDIAFLDEEDWRAVILHELGHVLGIGTLWDFNGLHAGGSSSDYYSGTLAQAEWTKLCPGGRLPIETDGGEGTAGGHWDEQCLSGELMTGYLSPGSIEMSRITIASLADMGYGVSFAGADSYTVDDLGDCGSYCPNQRRLFRGGPLYDKRNEKVSDPGHQEILRAAAIEFQRQRMHAPTNLPKGVTYLAAERLSFFIRDFDGKVKEETVTYDEVKDHMAENNIFHHEDEGDGKK